MSKFKVGQTYKTRNGAIARIYATDGCEVEEIHGATNSDEDGWDAMTWDNKGRYITDEEDSAWDLMPDVEYWYFLIAKDVIFNKEYSLIFDSEELRKEYIANKANIKILATFEKEKP